MSVHVSTLVWESDGPKGPNLLVLLAIADHANVAGEAWPGMELLAAKCRVTEKAARRTVRRLEAAGWIVTETGGGSRNPNRYWIDLWKLAETLPSTGGLTLPWTRGFEGPEDPANPPVHDPEPSRGRPEPSRGRPANPPVDGRGTVIEPLKQPSKEPSKLRSRGSDPTRDPASPGRDPASPGANDEGEPVLPWEHVYQLCRAWIQDVRPTTGGGDYRHIENPCEPHHNFGFRSVVDLTTLVCKNNCVVVRLTGRYGTDAQRERVDARYAEVESDAEEDLS